MTRPPWCRGRGVANALALLCCKVGQPILAAGGFQPALWQEHGFTLARTSRLKRRLQAGLPAPRELLCDGAARTCKRSRLALPLIGHIPGTALPGKPGHAGIWNDIITLTTLLGRYRDRVVSTKVVSPYGVAVLDPGGDEILALVTCYPFYFVGSAPDRFIVRAERVGNAS